MRFDAHQDVHDRELHEVPLEEIDRAIGTGAWREVTLALRTSPDDDAATTALRRELDPLCAATHAHGRELLVRMIVPARDARLAAELALDLLEAAVCRSGAKLVPATTYGSATGELEAVAVSA